MDNSANCPPASPVAHFVDLSQTQKLRRSDPGEYLNGGQMESKHIMEESNDNDFHNALGMQLPGTDLNMRASSYLF